MREKCDLCDRMGKEALVHSVITGEEKRIRLCKIHYRLGCKAIYPLILKNDEVVVECGFGLNNPSKTWMI